jgi:hypothetical protein
MLTSEMMAIVTKVAPDSAQYLAAQGPVGHSPQALLGILTYLPARAEAYFTRYARAVEQVRDALVLAPIFWTWMCLALAFLPLGQNAAAGSLNLSEAWERGPIGLAATVVGTAGLVALVFALTVAVPILDRLARRQVDEFVAALEQAVFERLGEATTDEAHRWEVIREAFGEGPERVRLAADALVEALDQEGAKLAELGKVRSEELRNLSGVNDALREVVGQLSTVVVDLEKYGQRERAAFLLLATTLTEANRDVVDLQALLDQLQRDREETVEFLQTVTASLREAAARLGGKTGRAGALVPKSTPWSLGRVFMRGPREEA